MAPETDVGINSSEPPELPRRPMKTRSNDHIHSFLEYYTKLESPPRYAVLVTGHWGSGKTWFIKKYIESKNRPEKYVYASLYGASSMRVVEDAIFFARHPILGSKHAKLLGRVAKIAIKATIKADLDDNGTDETTASFESQNTSLIELATIPDGLVIFIDDLERSAMKIADVLGFTNRLVEHAGARVILIANETKIDDDIYRESREKVVGKAFSFQSDTTGAIAHFVSELRASPEAEIIGENIDSIELAHELSLANNLRILRHTILDIHRTLQQLPQDILTNKNVIRKFISRYTVTSIELKLGKLSRAEVDRMCSLKYFTGSMKSELTGSDRACLDAYEKYAAILDESEIVSISTLANVISGGFAVSSELSEALHRAVEMETGSKVEPWILLWYWWSLPEEEFEDTLAEVIRQWDDCVYSDVATVAHVACVLISISNDKLVDLEPHEIVENTRHHFRRISRLPYREGEVDSFDLVVDGKSYKGLGFQALDCHAGAQVVLQMQQAMEARRAAALPTRSRDIVSALATDHRKFVRLIAHEMSSTPVLAYVNLDEMFNVIKSASYDTLASFSYAVEKRYNEGNIPFLLDERSFLLSLRARFAASCQGSSLGKLRIKRMVEDKLSDAIRKMGG